MHIMTDRLIELLRGNPDPFDENPNSETTLSIFRVNAGESIVHLCISMGLPALLYYEEHPNRGSLTLYLSEDAARRIVSAIGQDRDDDQPRRHSAVETQMEHEFRRLVPPRSRHLAELVFGG